MILGQLRTGARSTTYAALGRSWKTSSSGSFPLHQVFLSLSPASSQWKTLQLLSTEFPLTCYLGESPLSDWWVTLVSYLHRHGGLWGLWGWWWWWWWWVTRRRRRSRAIGTRAAVGGSVVSHRPPLCLRAQLTPHSTSLLAIRTQALAQTQYHPEVHQVLCRSLDQSTVVSAKELVSRSTWHFYLSYLMWSWPPVAWRSQRSHRNISFVLRCVVLYLYLYLSLEPCTSGGGSLDQLTVASGEESPW